MSQTSKRASNIELLRIVAMLMIGLHHIFVHCATNQLTDPATIAQLNNGWFCYPIMYERLLIFTAATSWGPIGNSIFILISGYFLACKKPDRIDLAKTAKNSSSRSSFPYFFSSRYRPWRGSVAKVGVSGFRSEAWRRPEPAPCVSLS